MSPTGIFWDGLVPVSGLPQPGRSAGYGHPQFRICQDSFACAVRPDSPAASRRNGMRGLPLAVCALAALHGGAFAADLPVRSYTKAPVVDPGINLSGFYAGINAGYGHGSTPTSLDLNAAEQDMVRPGLDNPLPPTLRP